MSDLKGKRVSTGSPASATEVIALRLIEAAGLGKDKDVQRERLSVAESVNAIKDGKIDAFFWVGILPTHGGDHAGVESKLLDQSDLLAKMNAKHRGIYSAGIIGGLSGPGQGPSKSTRGAIHPWWPTRACRIKEAYDHRQGLHRSS